MGQKDISEKILLEYNDVFADIINVLVFQGEERINTRDLINTSTHSQYKAEEGHLHEQERDISKYWKKTRTHFALLGLENQTQVERNMPFRIIGYDGAAYRSQLIMQSKRIVPVITFVLYFGTDKRWNKKRSIKELLDIPIGLDEFVSDYKINVFEIAWLKDEQLKLFKSDFGIVANFFVQKRKNKDYVPDDNRVIKHVDEVLKLLSVMTGDRKYENILYDEKKGRVHTMCDVAERLVNSGIEKGKIEGEAMLATLIKKLLSADRNADISLAVEDEEARKRLYKEFGIID